MQHDWWRDRYKVAADDLGVRPKIRDIGGHRLRANVAALVDWLRICYREGWLGRPRRNHLGTERKFKDRAATIGAKLAKMRVRMGIMGAYGEKAEQLGPPRPRERRQSPRGQSGAAGRFFREVAHAAPNQPPGSRMPPLRRRRRSSLLIGN